MNFKIDISLPSTSKLNNDEYAQYTKSILKLLETITAEKLGVKEELITSLSKNLDLLTEASRQSRSSKESEKINLLDKKRNELLSYLLSSFKIAKKSSLQAHKESAQTLSLEFKNYKGVSKASHNGSFDHFRHTARSIFIKRYKQRISRNDKYTCRKPD